jgi:hypothetical protein
VSWHCAICAATAFVDTCTIIPNAPSHRADNGAWPAPGRTSSRHCRTVLRARGHRSLDSLRQRLQRLVERQDGFARTWKHTSRITHRHPEFSDPVARRLSCTDRTVWTLPCRSGCFSSACAVDRLLHPTQRCRLDLCSSPIMAGEEARVRGTASGFCLKRVRCDWGQKTITAPNLAAMKDRRWQDGSTRTKSLAECRLE